MNLDLPYSAISEANCGDPFQLSPASRTKLLSQPRNLANRTPGGNSFDLRDFADDFKVHRPASCQLSDQTNKVSPPKIRIYCSKFFATFYRQPQIFCFCKHPLPSVFLHHDRHYQARRNILAYINHRGNQIPHNQ